MQYEISHAVYDESPQNDAQYEFVASWKTPEREVYTIFKDERPKTIQAIKNAKAFTESEVRLYVL